MPARYRLDYTHAFWKSYSRPIDSENSTRMEYDEVGSFASHQTIGRFGVVRGALRADFDFSAYVNGEFTLGDPFSEFPYGMENTFSLESLPSASKTVYIDFDGYHSVNNTWNHDIVFPPFSRDADPAFSDAELEEIQITFQNVAEDFLPFDVNVTTMDPGVEALRKSNALDDEFGIRVVATQATDGFGGGIGGVAQFNIFNSSIDTPVFAFNKGANVGAMTVSHEVGHAFGLFHDGLNGQTYHPGVGGNGETSWGPIMGAPFSSNVTQWSIGDYDGANNFQHDLQIITNAQNEIEYRVDDYGDTIGAAEPITLGAPLIGWGIIERNSDVDAFRFDWLGGEFEMNIRAFGERPNLDLAATLYDADGQIVLSDDPFDFVDAQLMGDLPAGEYTVLVEGVGRPGVYSDYGSLGLYTLEGPQLFGDFVADGIWNCQDVDLLVDRIVNQNRATILLDDFESYQLGGLDVDRTDRVWRDGLGGNNPPAGPADDGITVVPFLEIGGEGGNQFLAGTLSHGRPEVDPKPNAREVYTFRSLDQAEIQDGATRRIAFDVLVTADDRSPVNIGFSTGSVITLPTHWAGFVQIVPNQFDQNGNGPLGDGVEGTFSVAGRNGVVIVPELATGLAINEWHTIELEIDTLANTYDVFLGDTMIADDLAFRRNAENGDVQTFGFSGLEHQNSTSPVYTDNDGVRLDNIRYGIDDSLIRFDLNNDSVVDVNDLNEWLAIAGAINLPSGGAYLPGDANLDGFVDVSDFSVWNEHKFTVTAAWCQGDFNADGVTDTGDFNVWNQHKFQAANATGNATRPVASRYVREAIPADEISAALPLVNSYPSSFGRNPENDGSVRDRQTSSAILFSTELERTEDRSDEEHASIFDRIFAESGDAR